MCFNIGVIIGPILGGSLADPVNSFPSLFGPGSALGGQDGVWWMQRWPYALPNVLSAIFIFMSVIAVFLGLDEVSFPCTNFYTIHDKMGILMIFRPTRQLAIEVTGAES